MATLLRSITDTASSLVSLCEVRLRPAEPQPSQAGDENEDGPLAAVVREVSRELAADGILVVWHEQGHEPAFLFAGGACEPRSSTERDMVAAACGAAAGAALSPVRWSTSDDDPEAALLTARISADDGIITLTSFFRRIGGASRLSARESVTRLLPMVQAFFRLWSSRAHALATSRGLIAALNGSNVATLLVDADCRLVFANTAGERLISRNDGLRRAGQVLSGTRLADTIRLQASIEHVAHGDDTAGDAAPVVALSRANGRSLLAAIMPANRAATRLGDAAAVVHVFDPDQDLEALLTPVCRLYALSPVESRLASLLARGVAMVDAAKLMRVQEQTARSYLKQIFLKTDTNRQAELVCLMLRSAVRTAPGCPTRLV